MNRDWGKWFKAAGIRAIKTMAQSAIAMIGTAWLRYRAHLRRAKIGIR